MRLLKNGGGNGEVIDAKLPVSDKLSPNTKSLLNAVAEKAFIENTRTSTKKTCEISRLVIYHAPYIRRYGLSGTLINSNFK